MNDVILITSNRVGAGDERLGEILMQSFLNTVWYVEPKPAKIIFINLGVLVTTTEDSNILRTLSLLEKKGIQIFSCGTCLEYYHLKDKLRVGSITNMHDIVESLFSAGRIVKL